MFTLKPPRRKKRSKDSPKKRFPIIETISGPYKFSGRFNGLSVVIENPSEMTKLYSMGCFGKGTFSRSFPNYNNQKEPVIIRKRQYEVQEKWAHSGTDTRKVIIVDDSDNEHDEDYFVNLKPYATEQIIPCLETLNLTLEEAYFLMSALNCLTIKDVPDVKSAWTLFANAQENFIQNYIVYYYFRARNWVVKPGLKFGGDFLLYKDGPAFYHASYLVIIYVVKNDEQNTQICKRPMDWVHLSGLQRLTETAAKELLICQVIWPENLSVDTVKNQHDLFKDFTVNTVLLNRWVAKQERCQKTVK